MLEGADYGWHEEQNDPTPFIRYMLRVILACYTEFEERVGMMNIGGTKNRAYDIVKAYVEEKVGKFTGAEVIAACPKAGLFPFNGTPISDICQRGVWEYLINVYIG